MHLMYTTPADGGKRIYTLKKVLDGEVTKSAHPARFSPDDKYSRSVQRSPESMGLEKGRERQESGGGYVDQELNADDDGFTDTVLL